MIIISDMYGLNSQGRGINPKWTDASIINGLKDVIVFIEIRKVLEKNS